MKLSAIVLTRGDKDIRELRKSLTFCDEVLVFENKNFKDFSAERSKVAEKARGDWIFYVDDDEKITPELKKEILEVIKKEDFSAYAIPRRNMIFGKEFKHSGQWPDYQKRLFFKKNLKGWEGELHEEPIFEGELGHLKSPLLHYKNMTLSEMVEKTNKWSEIEAKLMFEAKHPPMTIPRFMTAMIREFWLRMISQAAFLDGTEGIIYALYQVYSRFISYAKLWELQINARSNL